jgi:hypothetical protein
MSWLGAARQRRGPFICVCPTHFVSCSSQISRYFLDFPVSERVGSNVDVSLLPGTPLHHAGQALDGERSVKMTHC